MLLGALECGRTKMVCAVGEESGRIIEQTVLGGDVMKQTQLFPMIRSKVSELLDGYVCTAQIKDIDNYIVPESLGGRQAVMGCMKLAYDAACLS